MLFKDDLDFLSNFYPNYLHWKGTIWPTVEHAFQAAKCRWPEDEETIRKAPSPAIAKHIGRKVLLRNDWEKIKVDVMTDLVWLKFEQSIELQEKLLSTKDEYLEEGNYWHSNFWGTCYCKKCEKVLGQNVLGIILMAVREENRER